MAVQAHVVYALTHLLVGTAGVGHAPHAHHVPALLVVRIGIEQVVTYIFQDRLQSFAGHVGDGGIGVGGGSHVHQPFSGDGLPRQ